MRLLIIGDLNGYYTKAVQIAKEKGFSVRILNNPELAVSALRNGEGADLLLIDVFHDIGCFIKTLLSERMVIPIIACGINNNKDIAVKAIRDGAKDYLPLPPDEHLIAAVLESIIGNKNKMIANSAAIKKVVKIADQVARTNATILLTGKSGVGKEVMSRYIHQQSTRADKPFIAINCAAIPDNLLESELFGHEKGAFTGALARRIGKFEEANKGTLLLDEISEIDIKLQAKLLRAIQEQEIDRVGGSAPVKLDIRIIATSNRDLKEAVRKQEFREDLFFRLNVINLNLPTLSERKEDIEDLAHFFVKKCCKANNIDIKTIPNDVLQILKTYDWPGNIREFENTIYRSVLLSESNELTIDSLNITLTKHSQNNFIGKTVYEVEKKHITETIKYYNDDFISAANILGISLNSLKKKLDNYEKEEAI